MNHEKIAKSDLSTADKMLVETASEATKLSYSPYSKFKVGSALLLSNNEIIKGANIENASYPLSMCAERTALYTAKMNHQLESVVKIAVTAKGEKEIENFVSPCGACRQVLFEQEQNQNNKIEVFLTSENIDYVVKIDSWGDFLPLSFDKNFLIKE